jgi:hypothetical protein
VALHAASLRGFQPIWKRGSSTLLPSVCPICLGLTECTVFCTGAACESIAFNRYGSKSHGVTFCEFMILTIPLSYSTPPHPSHSAPPRPPPHSTHPPPPYIYIEPPPFERKQVVLLAKQKTHVFEHAMNENGCCSASLCMRSFPCTCAHPLLRTFCCVL